MEGQTVYRIHHITIAVTFEGVGLFSFGRNIQLFEILNRDPSFDRCEGNPHAILQKADASGLIL
jgi:hypothetical protein